MKLSKELQNHLVRFFIVFWRLLLAFIHIALVIGFILVVAGAWISYSYGKDLPDPQDIGRYRSFENTRLYARDGQTLLYELIDPQGGRRTFVQFDHIPRILKEATIAVEDANFYHHAGVDVFGIIRAVWLNYQHQEIVSGGSTITQQLVRTLLLSPEELSQDLPEQQRYERKIREAILAYRVNREYSKDQILNLYLNEVYYGAQAYGIEAAAHVYFNKHVWELTDSEATLLAGLPQSPTNLNPFTNMQGAKDRQRITLDLMVKNGYVTPMQAKTIYEEPIILTTPSTSILAPHFVFYVRDLLEQYYGPHLLYHGGLRIITSIDLAWQAEAQRIAQTHIAELQKRNAHNAAVVMLSPEGEILAMVGSVDYTNKAMEGEVNVTLSLRQPGSALKPIVYAAALQRGWTPATIIWDTPIRLDSGNGVVYEPRNYDHAWHGPQRLRMALANSLNIPAVKTLQFVGIENFVNLATNMGITTLNDPSRYSLAMALGSNEVRLLDLTTAYHTFRNGGRYRGPKAVLRVENNRGEVLLNPQDHVQDKQVLGEQGEQIAFLITDILSDNRARWYMFGRNNVMELPNGIVAAVKTGTSNDWRDSWAVGYSTEVTTGAWVGNNDNASMQEIAGANGAGLIWRDLMIAYHKDHPSQPFPQPSGIVKRTICAGTGTIATGSCPSTVEEYFIEGVEPKSLPIRQQVVNVAGDGTCLAASYTPAKEVRQETFTVYPNEFREWAEQHGIPQPPTKPCPPSNTPDQMLALLMPINESGVAQGEQVVINGTARYPFTLEIGAGDAPTTWTVLNQSQGGIQNGLLGIWHTNDYPPGTYTIRLRVITSEGLPFDATQVVWVK